VGPCRHRQSGGQMSTLSVCISLAWLVLISGTVGFSVGFYLGMRDTRKRVSASELADKSPQSVKFQLLNGSKLLVETIDGRLVSTYKDLVFSFDAAATVFEVAVWGGKR